MIDEMEDVIVTEMDEIDGIDVIHVIYGYYLNIYEFENSSSSVYEFSLFYLYIDKYNINQLKHGINHIK